MTNAERLEKMLQEMQRLRERMEALDKRLKKLLIDITNKKKIK